MDPKVLSDSVREHSKKFVLALVAVAAVFGVGLPDDVQQQLPDHAATLVASALGLYAGVRVIWTAIQNHFAGKEE